MSYHLRVDSIPYSSYSCLSLKIAIPNDCGLRNNVKYTSALIVKSSVDFLSCVGCLEQLNHESRPSAMPVLGSHLHVVQACRCANALLLRRLMSNGVSKGCRIDARVLSVSTPFLPIQLSDDFLTRLRFEVFANGAQLRIS